MSSLSSLATGIPGRGCPKIPDLPQDGLRVNFLMRLRSPAKLRTTLPELGTLIEADPAFLFFVVPRLLPHRHVQEF